MKNNFEQTQVGQLNPQRERAWDHLVARGPESLDKCRLGRRSNAGIGHRRDVKVRSEVPAKMACKGLAPG